MSSEFGVLLCPLKKGQPVSSSSFLEGLLRDVLLLSARHRRTAASIELTRPGCTIPYHTIPYYIIPCHTKLSCILAIPTILCFEYVLSGKDFRGFEATKPMFALLVAP